MNIRIYMPGFVKNVYDSLPKNSANAVTLSGVYSFSFGLLRTQSLNAAVVIGGIAATASLVHTFTAPLFKSLFAKARINWGESMAVMTINYAITEVLLNQFTKYKFQIIDRSIVSMCLTVLLFNRATEIDLNVGRPYYFL